MAHARGVSNKIWRSVVMAGAMLGTQACGGGAKKPAPAAPTSEAKPEPTEAAPKPAEGVAAEPAVAPTTPEPAVAAPDPCAGTPAEAAKPDEQAAAKPDSKAKKKKRPRGSGDKPVGRGFVLA